MTTSKVPNPSQRIVASPPAPRRRSARGRGRLLWCLLAGDILRRILLKLGGFPENVRLGLGARLEGAHLDVLEAPIRAQCPNALDAKALEAWRRRKRA